MSNRPKGKALAQTDPYRVAPNNRKPVKDEEAGEDGGGGSVVLAILLVVLGGILYALLSG